MVIAYYRLQSEIRERQDVFLYLKEVTVTNLQLTEWLQGKHALNEKTVAEKQIWKEF